MKNKKGFTLVELLAVIAILAILVIIALPNVMGMFNEAKKNSFTTELKEVYKVAQQTWISDSMFNTGEKIYARCSSEQCTSELELTGRKELEYFIKISKSGDVIEYYASDGTYQFGYKGNGLLVTNIKDVTSISDITDEEKIEIKCNKVTVYEPLPPEDNYLMIASSGQTEESNFLRTNIKRKDIEKVTFSNSLNGHTANGIDCFDVSKGNNGSILLWATDSDNDGLKEITIGYNGRICISDASYLFSYFVNLTSIEGFNNLRTDRMTFMQDMFYNCKSLTSLDLSDLDTSKVSNMSYLFYGCSELTSLNLSNWDTSSAVLMSDMFYGCNHLTSLDLSSFDTTSVVDMSNMFHGCLRLESVNISSFRTPNVTNMSAMFDNCQNLLNIDVSHFDTSKVTNMGSMFYACYKITELDVSNFDTSKVTNMRVMFMHCDNLVTIYTSSSFVTTNVTESERMFVGSTKLVGGAGTVYDNDHYELEYAHIDGGPSNPGYFTLK